jgi:predicted nucleic acid-binding protein
MTKPKTKKTKITKKAEFDLHSSQFFLTYSKCELTKDKILEYLNKIINKETLKKTYHISNYIIVNESHEDGTPHKHIYLKLDKKIRIKDKTFFDIKTETTIEHPNIQGVRSTKAVIDYILKHGDYISKYKIDNLKIAQKVIEKEIQNGRYVTNNLIAREYPSTYTIYRKCLID